MTFKGNRFNILFGDAGLVHYYSQYTKGFLENVHGTPNGLLKSILLDLKVEDFLAGAKALGLIEKLITTPLWRVTESTECHIMDMNSHYLKLKQFLTGTAKDPDNFVHGMYMDKTIQEMTQSEATASPAANLLLEENEGNHNQEVTQIMNPDTENQEKSQCRKTSSPFPDKRTDPDKDKILAHLLKPSSYDDHVKGVVQCVLSAWSKYSTTALKDHLPGGIHAKHTNDTHIREITKS